MHTLFLYLLAIFNLVSMVHLGLFIVGANAYDIKQYRRSKRARKPRRDPLVSVIIPAHNEAVVIKRTLDSVLSSTYKNIEVLVVDDGSQDNTSMVVRDYISHLRTQKIRSTVVRKLSYATRGARVNTGLPTPNSAGFRRIYERQENLIRFVKIYQKNAGKAAAMNNAIRNYARGQLTMCLDGDSVLAPRAIEKAVRYFDDRKIIGVAANVRLVDTGTILSKVQRFEHLIGYRSKKFYSVTNTEFIVGGVASTYRTSVLKKAGLYDSDTMTEDIGLSMKLIARYGNKDKHIVYAADVVAMTEGVQTFKALLRQRYRWKLGSLQNLYKYRDLIGRGESGKHTRLLTKYRLPIALFGELRLVFEPMLLGYLMYLSLYYGTINILLGAYLTITLYILWNIWPDEHLSIKEKFSMSGTGCIMYGLFYIMDVVQIAAVYHCIKEYHRISRNDGATTWISPTRAGVAIKV